jgi:hypothetical protein
MNCLVALSVFVTFTTDITRMSEERVTVLGINTKMTDPPTKKQIITHIRMRRHLNNKEF